MASTPRRRSARLSSRDRPPHSAVRKTPLLNFQLDSLIERDETPEVNSIDDVIATPAADAALQSQIDQLSQLKTPTTAPRPTNADMHPKTVHQTTSKAPDSGLRLGFGDAPASRNQSKASWQNSPSKITMPEPKSASFEFKFRSESHLSNNAQKLMDNLRDEAARIKAQMKAEKDVQEQKDQDADHMFPGFNATGRKIAKAKGKTGRFSDIHMAEFKKMDSIANHASAYRVNASAAGFAQPTQQSLKRSGSKAGFDEPERPQTAGKGTPKTGPTPSSCRRLPASSPFKVVPNVKHIPEPLENSGPAKRRRQSQYVDVSASRVEERIEAVTPKLSTLPRIGSGIPRSLSPTKSSLARTTGVKVPVPSASKSSTLPRSNSVKSLRTTLEAARFVQQPDLTSSASLSRIPRPESLDVMRPLPPLPHEKVGAATSKSSLKIHPQSTNNLSSHNKSRNLSSRLPTFAGLKSILRSTRAPASMDISKGKLRTPERPRTANSAMESLKKVDFTPSVKSRYAVKLAAESPSPAKHQLTPGRALAGAFDPSDYCLDDETDKEIETEEWEDAESEVDYPILPPSSPTVAPVIHTFAQKAQNHNRRESTEFKSIFTTLHHPSRDSPLGLTSVNTAVNKTNPMVHANKVMQSPSNISSQSPSTIRRVRPSDIITPFEDTIKTVPHGLPGKKRRRESNLVANDHGSDEDAKENRRLEIPGGWEDSVIEEDEGTKRGGKRVRVTAESPELMDLKKQEAVKKPSAARAEASKNAKDRKSRGILSMNRLNMLARPKSRNA